MAKIICVHGVNQHNMGQNQLHQKWTAALFDGLEENGEQGRRAAKTLRDDDAIRYAFYGSAFRRPGAHLGSGDDIVTLDDLTYYELEMLDLWWEEAQRVDPTLVGPPGETLARTPSSVQGILRVLGGLSFFEGEYQDKLMLGSLAQLRRYFTEDETRAMAVETVASQITEDTQVIVGHSLGSVVAYEALCANPGWPVRALVTIGSPLGTRNLVFDRLRPAPVPPEGEAGELIGIWPGSVRTWTNVADEGDVVALCKDLRTRFGPQVRGSIVYNGAKAHDAVRYLSAKETGEGILLGLPDSASVS